MHKKTPNANVVTTEQQWQHPLSTLEIASICCKHAYLKQYSNQCPGHGQSLTADIQLAITATKFAIVVYSHDVTTKCWSHSGCCWYCCRQLSRYPHDCKSLTKIHSSTAQPNDWCASQHTARGSHEREWKRGNGCDQVQQGSPSARAQACATLTSTLQGENKAEDGDMPRNAQHTQNSPTRLCIYSGWWCAQPATAHVQYTAQDAGRGCIGSPLHRHSPYCTVHSQRINTVSTIHTVYWQSAQSVRFSSTKRTCCHRCSEKDTYTQPANIQHTQKPTATMG